MRKLKPKGIELPKGADAIYHFIRDGYCVAKPAMYCAVFAHSPTGVVPVSQDASGSVLVQNESVAHCQVGKWYSVAYMTFGGRGSWWEVVRPLSGVSG